MPSSTESPQSADARESAQAPATGRAADAAAKRSTSITRLSVNISSATTDALTEISRDKGISTTEAVRRLIGYGLVVYRAIKAGSDVLIRDGQTTERVILLD